MFSIKATGLTKGRFVLQYAYAPREDTKKIRRRVKVTLRSGFWGIVLVVITFLTNRKVTHVDCRLRPLDVAFVIFWVVTVEAEISGKRIRENSVLF